MSTTRIYEKRIRIFTLKVVIKYENFDPIPSLATNKA